VVDAEAIQSLTDTRVTMHDTSNAAPATNRNVAMGNLRAFVTLLVIAHHAVLAYHPYAPPPSASLSAEPMLWQAFPIVDSHRWPGIDVFVGFNDAFFMSLMFLVSGLFLWPSLQRKGPSRFLGGRLRRLGIPFLVAAGLLSPLAYLPSYLQTGPAGPSGFWKTWLSLPHWPSGPAWFLWVLLAFDAVASALTWIAPGWGDGLRQWAERLRRPAAFFWVLAAFSAVAYVPLAIALGPARWASYGPFSFQVSRVLHYCVYFFAGAGLGAAGLGRGLLLPGGALARRWPVWMGASVGAFLLLVAIFLTALSQGAAAEKGTWTAVDLAFVLSCACSSFAFLALFVRFARPGPIGESLAANAYGMYITHYVFVTWLQYTLLRYMLPGAAKGTIVFVGAVALSWSLTAALRRIPAVGKVISSVTAAAPATQVGASLG
jgi:peptidoglycan/LPS O-acetylase OafA/YrhL